MIFNKMNGKKPVDGGGARVVENSRGSSNPNQNSKTDEMDFEQDVDNDNAGVQNVDESILLTEQKRRRIGDVVYESDEAIGVDKVQDTFEDDSKNGLAVDSSFQACLDQ